MHTVSTGLPFFRFHSEPIKTGSLIQKNHLCECCGTFAYYKYTGPFYSRRAVDSLCPVCIANGLAARKYDGHFVDPFSVKQSHGQPISQEMLDELTCRTPGFHGAQQEIWFCFDGIPGVYLGDFNCKPENFMTEEFWEQVCQTNEMWHERNWFDDMRKFSMTGSVSLHVFKALDSETRSAYFDFT